jgi:peptidyl-prolyl cis-trans isomerase SDCCAG10
MISSSNARQAEIERMEAEIRKLSRKNDDDSDEEVTKKKPKRSMLQEELAKYSKGRGLVKKGKKRDETDMLAALESFRSKLKNTALHEAADTKEDGNEKEKNDDLGVDEGGVNNAEEDAGMEVDADTEFLGHLLHFPKDNGEETAKAERDYEVIDPRQRGAKAKEEERERRRVQKAKSGGGGRHRR